MRGGGGTAHIPALTREGNCFPLCYTVQVLQTPCCAWHGKSSPGGGYHDVSNGSRYSECLVGPITMATFTKIHKQIQRLMRNLS